MISFSTILPEITENSIIFLLNANFLGFHVSHQTTKVYDTREVIDQYHQNHKSKCQPISHYPVIKMSIFTLAVRTQYSGGETTSFHMINLITNMHLIDVLSHQSLYKELSL